MGQFSVSLTDSIEKLRIQRDALAAIAAPTNSFNWSRRSGSASLNEPANIAARHGHLVQAASGCAGRDFIWLGIIDWAYRIQRPQHLAANLADIGNRLFYISIAFEHADADGRFKLIDSPHPGVFEVRLRLTESVPHSIYRGFTRAQIVDINGALDEFRVVLGVRDPVVVTQYPSWYPVAVAVPGATLVYDCLDFMAGFANVPAPIIELERQLIDNADIVVAASQPLADHLASQRDSVPVIRNAADVDFFAGASSALRSEATPVIGYFGAIAEWFASEWIVYCARAHPNWRFQIIGEVAGADVDEARLLPNITFLGEKPYKELPNYLSSFDVAIIPFKMSKLIECVNPVKLYEYMSQGTPVVSCAMPEVVASTDLVYVASDEIEFERQIALALSEDTPTLQEQRRQWALQHTWMSRAAKLDEVVNSATPRVSVVILSYNSVSLTRACLHSVLTLSDYPNLEVIIVDNASSDQGQTVQYLGTVARRDSRVRTILNASNLGFAAGNNVGLRAATGEFIVLLNNDTHVTRGWVRDLVRPLVRDATIGLVGPLTNNIGNEQKVSLTYASTGEMMTSARELTAKRSRMRLKVETVAFFCAAMRRSVLENVGYLDEAYGRGFFEDDDYCKRVLEAGYNIVIADDVFIHHELSASFGKLPSAEKVALMENNKAIFETRWGVWKPHRYRDEEGFGG